MVGGIGAVLHRSRLVLAALVAILLAGAIAWRDIPKEAEPDVQVPIIYVQMQHDGISPEDAERLLVRPLEQELRGLGGVKEMRARAFEGGGFVLIEFRAGFNANRALQDVRERVDRVRPDLPAATRDPTVHEVNLSLFPVLVVTLSGELPERQLHRLAHTLRDRIEGVPAVLEAKIVGTREEQVEVVVDPLRAESYGLNAEALIQRVTRGNQIIAAGALESGSGRFGIKVPGLIATLQDILEVPLVAVGDRVVRVRDVAEVRRTFKDRENLARRDGRPAVAIEVSKRIGENIIDTVSLVREVVEAERAFWPPGVAVGYSQDKSENIRTMLADLENNLALAVLLVLILVLYSLGWRSTALVAVAVPGSFLAGVLMLAGMGLTVNIVVLFGLIFAAGNVVDGAIVVTEFADARMAEGMERRAAYSLAVRRMAVPIISSTATQLAAFLPLLFWPGIVGKFMQYLPISQFVTMMAALLMALVFVPVLGAIFGKAGGGTGTAQAVQAIAAADIGRLRGHSGLYVRALAAALRSPGLVLLVAAIGLGAVTYAYGRYGRGVEFFPDVEPDRAIVIVQARGNLAVAEQDRLVREVEDQVLAVARERGEIASVYATVGRVQGAQQDTPEDAIGTIRVEMGDWRTRRHTDAIMAEIAARTQHLAGIVVEARRERAGPPIGKPVQVELASRFPELLEPAAARVAARMQEMPGLRDIEDTRPLPGIQWRFEVDRAQAAKFGADVATVGNMLKLVTNGLLVTKYRPNDADDEIDVVVRYPPEHRTLSQLDAMRVRTEAGLVPVANFVRRLPEPRTGTIFRSDAKRVMSVRADVRPGVLADSQVRALQSWLAASPLDPRIDVRFKGEDEEQKAAAEFLKKAFTGALGLIFLILLWQFNSFYETGLILSAVVMSTLGVLIGLLVAGQPFGIVMSGIGVVALAGIVVANNIVLIDTYKVLRADGLPPYQALLTTGAERLRPVLLTALNNVVGLFPLTLGINVDFLAREITVGAPSGQWWTDLARAIVYGLGFATVLTLVLTPCALMLRENVSAWVRRHLSRRPAPPPAAGDAGRTAAPEARRRTHEPEAV